MPNPCPGQARCLRFQSLEGLYQQSLVAAGYSARRCFHRAAAGRVLPQKKWRDGEIPRLKTAATIPNGVLATEKVYPCEGPSAGGTHTHEATRCVNACRNEDAMCADRADISPRLHPLPKPLSHPDSDGKVHLLSGPLRLCAFARGPARTLPTESPSRCDGVLLPLCKAICEKV